MNAIYDKVLCEDGHVTVSPLPSNDELTQLYRDLYYEKLPSSLLSGSARSQLPDLTTDVDRVAGSLGAVLVLDPAD
jgi:hypothetical protein